MSQFLRDLTTADVQHILGRALLDADFRKKLVTDAAGTLATLGFKAGPGALAFFAKLGEQSFDSAADSLEQHLTANPLPLVWD